MDWKIFFLTFGTVFLAELGDKTQLATMMFSTQSKSPWIVFAGAALALVISSFLAVIVGQVVEKYVPVNIVKAAAGCAFIVIGGLIIVSLLKGAGS